MNGLLDDVKILGLTQAHQAPMCTMFLAAMGADVIKIEPLWGERSRFFAPLIKGKLSPFFAFLNRNKRAITLNLKSPKGVKIFKDLVKLSDVVVENFSPGTMDRLGLGYETIKEINSRIIFMSMSGFGQYGPNSRRLSFSPIAEAASGFMGLLREKIRDNINSSATPMSQHEPIADIIPALFAVIGILSALHYRERTGHGQRIDLAQVDCMVGVTSSISFHSLAETTFFDSLKKYGAAIPETYKAKDGEIIIMMPRGMEERLAKLLGIEPQRIDGQIVEEWVRDKTVDEVVNLLVKARLPVSPVLSLDEVINDPHIIARDMIVEVDHPDIGKAKMPGFPIKFSETKSTLEKPAPLLGEHNVEVLSTLLGYSDEEIAKLKEEQVI